MFRIGAVQIGGSMYRLIFADRSDGGAIEQRACRDARLVPPHDADGGRAAQSAAASTSSPCASGDGVADLAARMQGTERSLELFRLLNGLQPGDALAPGQLVKIVVD